jgi:hypothetical protein
MRLDPRSGAGPFSRAGGTLCQLRTRSTTSKLLNFYFVCMASERATPARHAHRADEVGQPVGELGLSLSEGLSVLI